MENKCCCLISLIVSCLIVLVKGDDTRYLLYSVNPGEGFNLRRDVYMRAATLVKELRKTEDWVLVLPPWSNLYHWKTKYLQESLKWEKFFDVPSLSEYVPVIEFDDYLSREGRSIDEVHTLQHFSEGWETFSEKLEERPCIERQKYRKVSPGIWKGYVYGFNYDDVKIKSFRCVSVLGFVKTLLPMLKERKTKSVMLERLETVMHTNFGRREYWLARKSMVYAQHLREEGNKFMKHKKKKEGGGLGYDPGTGKGRSVPDNGGGNFISVHLRRADYLRARPGVVPSLKGAANQLNTLKKELNLQKVFLATDATNDEKKLLKEVVGGLVWYSPTEDEQRHFGSGGVAIIDQWIASHAKYFIGSKESTFSFRIREDRQLMGFSKESTFNDLCGSQNGGDENNPHSCEKPSYWKIDDSVREELEAEQLVETVTEQQQKSSSTQRHREL